MNKAEQKLNEFIEKNLQKEKDKFNDGRKHNYFDWQELKTNLDCSATTIRELEDEIEVYQEFLKEMGYQTTFRQWINNKN